MMIRYDVSAAAISARELLGVLAMLLNPGEKQAKPPHDDILNRWM